jgi:hypothetical protein
MNKIIAAILPGILIQSCLYKTEIRPTTQYITEDTVDYEAGVDASVPWFKASEIKKIKEELNITVPAEKPADPVEKEERKEIIKDLKIALSDKVETAKKVDKVTENMIKLAVFSLKQKGYDQEAADIEQEYLDNYQNYTYLYAIGSVGAIGDHPPMWEWLDKVEKRLREKLGDFIMKVTRLEDLKTLNYGIPVVLQPGGDERFDPMVLFTKKDYSEHFIPFSGVISYWITWGVCVGATFGAGAVTFICSPIGMLAERVVVTRVAPPLSDKIWDRANL